MKNIKTLIPIFLRISLIFQNIPRLAVQYAADGVQCGKTDGLYFSCLQIGEIHIGNADPKGRPKTEPPLSLHIIIFQFLFSPWAI